MGKKHLHNCEPPTDAMNEWLQALESEVENYGHLLIEQKSPDSENVVAGLRPYFESAHFDAREHFHRQIGISLHPDVVDDGAHAQYPSCLPKVAKRGLFGEVLAGLISQYYSFIGEHEWQVPVFLFRYHADVEAYLFALARDPDRKRQIFGRFGNDFIGLVLAEDGSVERVMAGEAKWRKSLTASVVEELMYGKWIDDEDNPGQKIRSGKGIWHEVNRDLPVPQGLRQLQRLLEQHDPDGFDTAILSMERALLVNSEHSIPRTDLILISGNAGKTRTDGDCLIGCEEKPAEYSAGNDLQVVEMYLKDGEELVDKLYATLWS